MKKRQFFIFSLVVFAVSYLNTGFVFAGSEVSGKVNFIGTAPTPKAVNFGPEKQCALVHGDKMPMEETILVNSNNTLRNVLVYIKEGVSAPSAAPTEPVVIDQAGCVFKPHVTVARVGQKVVFKNSDTLLHNVRTLSKANKAFNIAQPIQNMKTEKTFTEPEIGIQLKCDVHFWMLSYLHVLSHSYHAVTGEDGSFSIKDLPVGTYTIEAWHEKLGTQVQTITVAEGEQKTLDFTMEKKD